MKKIVIFGLGGKYKFLRKKGLLDNLYIVAAIDNNHDLNGKTIDGIQVYSPDALIDMNYDYVLLVADRVKNMREQLYSYGIPNEKILLWEVYNNIEKQGIITRYECSKKKNLGGKIALVMFEMHYNGGSLVILDLAKALMSRKYSIDIITQYCDTKLLDEIKRIGLNIIIAPALNIPSDKEKELISDYDLIIANVYQTISLVNWISNIKPTIWWIHENTNKYDKIYESIDDNYSDINVYDIAKRVDIITVSNMAKHNLLSHHPNLEVSVISFGIPDYHTDLIENKKNRLSFTIIGVISERKGQLIFLEAIKMINCEFLEKTEFHIIGIIPDDTYANSVVDQSKEISNLYIHGEYEYGEVQKHYCETDVVVCASLEETMSMTIVEGLMNEKVCITTDKTGVAEFLTDERNALICRAGDPESLYKKMKWVIDNEEKRIEIAKRGRELYKDLFTLDKMGEQFSNKIDEYMP